jgi:hypothetical protein
MRQRALQRLHRNAGRDPIDGMAFVRVYRAATSFEAHFVRSVLEQGGLHPRVTNDGFAPFGLAEMRPEVWVEEEGLSVARAILAELARRDDGALSLADTGVEGRVSDADPDE